MGFRTWIAGGVYDRDTRMDGKMVVITGCNTGIGLETVKDLSKRGASILMACRNMKKTQDAIDELLREMPHAKLSSVDLDLSSLDSVRKCAQTILDTTPQIHVLILNAGVMMCPFSETKDGFEMQFGTNHLGHFLFTNLLLDRIKESAPARIVVLSSFAHTRGQIHWNDVNLRNNYTPWRGYTQSKLANVLFVKELAEKLKGTGVTAYSLHPGFVKSDLYRHTNETCLGRTFQGMIESAFYKTTPQGAQTTLYCTMAEELANESGLYYSDCKEKRAAPRALIKEDAKRLWDISVTMTNLETRH